MEIQDQKAHPADQETQDQSDYQEVTELLVSPDPQDQLEDEELQEMLVAMVLLVIQEAKENKETEVLMENQESLVLLEDLEHQEPKDEWEGQEPKENEVEMELQVAKDQMDQ